MLLLLLDRKDWVDGTDCPGQVLDDDTLTADFVRRVLLLCKSHLLRHYLLVFSVLEMVLIDLKNRGRFPGMDFKCLLVQWRAVEHHWLLGINLHCGAIVNSN